MWPEAGRGPAKGGRGDPLAVRGSASPGSRGLSRRPKTVSARPTCSPRGGPCSHKRWWLFTLQAQDVGGKSEDSSRAAPKATVGDTCSLIDRDGYGRGGGAHGGVRTRTRADETAGGWQKETAALLRLRRCGGVSIITERGVRATVTAVVQRTRY